MRHLWLVFLASCTTEMALPPSGPPPVDGLRPTVRAPAQAAYDPTSFAPVTEHVILTLSNPGRDPVRIGDVRVRFAAARDGVEMPCNDAPVRPREPRVIGPGERVSFERTIDCAMPFPGRYAVQALASWSDAPLHKIGVFAIDVIDVGGRGPRPIADRPGLLGALAGAQLADPTSSWEAAIAILNESAVVQPLGAARVTLQSHPIDHDVWCTGPSSEIKLPATIGPGRIHVVRARLACDLEAPGVYVVRALLELAGSRAPTEIGELRVRITNDATELRPLSPPLP